MVLFEGEAQTTQKLVLVLVIEKNSILNMKFLNDTIWVRTHDLLPGNFATTNYFNSSRSPPLSQSQNLGHVHIFLS